MYPLPFPYESRSDIEWMESDGEHEKAAQKSHVSNNHTPAQRSHVFFTVRSPSCLRHMVLSALHSSVVSLPPHCPQCKRVQVCCVKEKTLYFKFFMGYTQINLPAGPMGKISSLFSPGPSPNNTYVLTMSCCIHRNLHKTA